MSHAPRARSARARAALELAGLLALSLLSGCEREGHAPVASASSAPSERAPSANGPKADAHDHAPAPLPEVPKDAGVPPLLTAGCRALRVKGDVKTAAGVALAAMAPIEGNEWLQLSAGSELVVRHSVSARELLLRGPGQSLPCRAGQEQFLVESGTLSSAPGTGVRPGAEVWIGTPFGTVRYGDAAFDLTVTKARATLSVKSGSIWTDPPWTARGRSTSSAPMAPQSLEAGRVQGGEQASSSGNVAPDALLAACQRSAEAAKEGAALVASGAPGLGERAAAHLVQRRHARAACMAAAAGARRFAEGERRARLEDQIRAADAAWEAVPPPLTVSGPRR